MENSKTSEINKIVKQLDLIPHPEGGFYRETYRSEEIKGKRNLITSIYFLLTSDQISHLHRIKSDEIWYYHAGSPLIVHILDAFGHHEHIVGNDFEKGYLPQFLVPKNTIFGSTVLEKDSFSLVSCVVSPGFDFADFELFKKDELIEAYPMHKDIIEKLAIS
ncbi:MAG: cupin domain-containing protein [Flavobacteriia bacterium]|jgi:predicted cupin superfamily sugar epimerase